MDRLHKALQLSIGNPEPGTTIGDGADVAARHRVDLEGRWKSLDVKTYAPLLRDNAEFKASGAVVSRLLGAEPEALTEAEFTEASGHLATMEQCIAERVGDYEGQQQGARAWLASFTYLTGEINKVKQTDPPKSKEFTRRFQDARLEVETNLKLGITEYTATIAAAVDEQLAGLSALAIEINETLNPATGPASRFDWQNPTTWDVQAIRYEGAGTKDYINGLSGADPAMIDRIAKAEVGDRHSAAKICTGKPMHHHTGGGSGGISFAYGHISGVKVEPVIYDYASKRNENIYQWKHSASSNGPAGLPNLVKAKV